MKKYDVAIIGAGITGTALLYVLSRYTNIKSIALVEKYSKIAAVNSQRNNNSQTLHFGDIETNYTLQKARRVKEAAEMVKRYVETTGKEEGLFNKTNKMVLAVGKEEAKRLKERYEEFKELFPELKMIGREEIAELEPNVVAGRNQGEELLALATRDGYAIDFGKLSGSFVKHAKENGKEIDVFLDHNLKEIKKIKGDKKDKKRVAGYELVSGKKSMDKKSTDKKDIKADIVVVCAGSHSLIFAQSLGYGKELGLLPVAGSFYCGKKMLNGKVYTMQLKKLPFAAIHGDPDVENSEETRFGPTAKVLPILERHNCKTVPDFFKTSAFTIAGVHSLLRIISDPINFRFILRNFSYDLPFFGKRIFLREIRKIVPSATIKDIKLGKGIGGIRPQVVDTKEKKMNMGEAKIIGDKIIFNITPSPGASVCLKNAEDDARKVIGFFEGKFEFDEGKFREELKVQKII